MTEEEQDTVFIFGIGDVIERAPILEREISCMSEQETTFREFDGFASKEWDRLRFYHCVKLIVEAVNEAILERSYPDSDRCFCEWLKSIDARPYLSCISSNSSFTRLQVLEVCYVLCPNDFDYWNLEKNTAFAQLMRKSEKDRIRKANKKGGEKRQPEHQNNYEIHKQWWDEWQKDKSLYKNFTAYDRAMEDKTGACEKTIRNHRKEFSGNK